MKKVYTNEVCGNYVKILSINPSLVKKWSCRPSTMCRRDPWFAIFTSTEEKITYDVLWCIKEVQKWSSRDVKGT